MTTEWKHRRRPGAPVLLGAAVAGLAVGLALVVAGALTTGSAAAYGALVGAGLALGLFLGGAFVVDLVAGLMPSASLLVALLTYILEVVVMALVFVALSGSGLLDGTLSRGWLGAGVIVTTLVWLAAQLRLTTTARIPAYDVAPEDGPTAPSGRGEASAR